jgi:ABC-type branched-subunit amino acid transport system ATPase component
MTSILRVSDLRKTFGGIAAVDGVSFEVREGEILGIIGPNGSGKSTLFNCVLGQYAPTAGRVFVDGGKRQACVPAISIASASAARSNSCRCFRNSPRVTISSSPARNIAALWHRACSALRMSGCAPPPIA